MTRIEIYGPIEPDCEDMFGTMPGTLKKVKTQVEQGPAPYAVHVNSPGGSFTEALAVANYLRDLECEVLIDAAAYSAATLFTAIGKKVTMRPGSLLMFHSPSSEASGTAKDMADAAAYLEAIKNQAAALYAMRTKKTAEEMAALMDGETWMDAAKAVEMGFADVAEGAPVEAVALARYTAGMKVSERAPDSVRLMADPIGFVAKMFGTEANAEALANRAAAMTALQAREAEMKVKVEELAAKLLAETEAKNAKDAELTAKNAELTAAKDAVLRFEEKVARRVAEMAAASHIEPVKIKDQKHKPSAAELWNQYREIQDPAEKTRFYRANQAVMDASSN